MNKTAAQVIKNNVNGIYMTGLISKKGWTKQHAANLILEWIISGSKASLNTFMESK